MTRPNLAANAVDMPRSGIREVMDLAWAAGDDVIGLHVGEPSFSTPSHIVSAAKAALDAGHTRYVPNAGIMPLREMIAEKLKVRNNILVDRNDVVVTAGGMEAILLSLIAVLRPGDEVMVPDPGWPNFTMAVQLLGAVPVRYALRQENDFNPMAADLEALVTDRTRLIIVNTPSNPLGAVMDHSSIEGVLAVARRHDLWVLSDECYDAIVFDQEHLSPASLDTDGRVISCYSFSKTYAMTGMRVGYVAAPPELGPVFAKLQEPMVACVNAPAQYAALAALEGPYQPVEVMRDAYRIRRDKATEVLDAAGVGHFVPQGSFFVWIDVSDRSASVAAFAADAVTSRRVAVAPGTTFGPSGEGFVRCSLATDESNLVEGLGRLLSD